jgi:hypothetical protein
VLKTLVVCAHCITRQFFGRDDEASQNREFFSSVLSLDVQASKHLSVLAVFSILILYFIFPLFSPYSLLFLLIWHHLTSPRRLKELFALPRRLSMLIVTAKKEKEKSSGEKEKCLHAPAPITQLYTKMELVQ